MDNLAVAFTKSCWWHLLVLFTLSLVSRVLPRIFCPEARGKDAYYHLYAAGRIRENGFRLPQTLEGFLLPGIYDYPPMLHYLWAFFPKSWQLEVEKLTSAAFDALNSQVVYL